MCFSATASFTASAVLMGVGALNFTQIRSKKTILLAAFPFLFALQQLSEGFLWLNMTHWLNPSLTIFLSYVFLLMAYCIWPILTPLANYLIENNPRKKRIMLVFFIIGMLISAVLLFFVLSAQTATLLMGHSIEYILKSPYLPIELTYLLSVLYLVPVTIVWLLSSYTILKWIGVLSFISAIITWTLATECYTSVWCFFGALTSLLIYFYLRQVAKA